MKPDPDFDISDVFYELGELCSLLDAIRLTMGETSFMKRDGSRNEELDRAYGMVKIAQREAARLHDVTSVFDGPDTWEHIPYGQEKKQ
jgi:hypothetical protein